LGLRSKARLSHDFILRLLETVTAAMLAYDLDPFMVQILLLCWYGEEGEIRFRHNLNRMLGIEAFLAWVGPSHEQIFNWITLPHF
jgi:hypothetical protein